MMQHVLVKDCSNVKSDVCNASLGQFHLLAAKVNKIGQIKENEKG